MNKSIYEMSEEELLSEAIRVKNLSKEIHRLLRYRIKVKKQVEQTQFEAGQTANGKDPRQ